MKFKIQTWTIVDGWIDADKVDGVVVLYDTFKQAMDEMYNHLVELDEAGMEFDECDYRVVPDDYTDDRSQTIGVVRNPG